MRLMSVLVLVPGMRKHSQPKILVGRPLITQQTSCYKCLFVAFLCLVAKIWAELEGAGNEI
jgi:hypothetical protein